MNIRPRLNTRVRHSRPTSPASPLEAHHLVLTVSHQRPLSPAATQQAIMPAPTFPPPMFPHAQIPAPSPPRPIPSATAAPQPTTPLSKKRSLSLLSLTPSPSSTPTLTNSKRVRQAPSFASALARPNWVTAAACSASFAPEFGDIPLRNNGTEGVLSNVVNGGILVLVVVEGILGHWAGMGRVRALLRSEGGRGAERSAQVACFAVGTSERTEGAGATPGGEEIPYLWDYSRRLLLRLGMLHPLGGGRTGMDAVLVFDTKGRRRMTFPVGWRGEGEEGVEEVVWRVVRGVEWLMGEEDEEVGMEVEMG